MDSAEGALRAAAALGPYFAWKRLPTTAKLRPTDSHRGDWRPLADLSDPQTVAERVGAARAVLSGPPRAVASVTFLGIASRLVSPPFAALVLAEVLPLPDRLWWRSVPRGPLPIGYESAAPAAVGTHVATALLEPVAPVLQAFAERYRISAKVMWGNVASALAGAAGVLADSRPEHGDRAGIVLERALAEPPLAGTGTVVRPDPGYARRFLVRHNCCLYYRITGAGICGDCVLMPDHERRRAWDVALARCAVPRT